MKRKLLISGVLVASLISSTSIVKAGGDSFEEGKMIISLGYGSLI